VLQTALARVEEQMGLTPNDPALLEVKRSVVRKVAALEIQSLMLQPGDLDSS